MGRLSGERRCLVVDKHPVVRLGVRGLLAERYEVEEAQDAQSALERVVDEPGTGHRLDHRADGLPVGLLDSAGEGSQGVGVRRDGELIEVLSLVAQKTDVNSLST
jgi:CheY-like chemotaxis protein